MAIDLNALAKTDARECRINSVMIMKADLKKGPAQGVVGVAFIRGSRP